MNTKTKDIIKAILILCISVFFIYILIKFGTLLRHINIRSLRRYIVSFGPLAALVFVAIYSLKAIFVVLPSVVLTVLAGNIFGPIKGFLLTMIGIYFSSTLAFYLAKSLGKPFVDKITKGKLLKLDENIEVHGLKIILFMRLSTLFPYDPLSYAAGLTKIKYNDFIIASMIGICPEMLAYSYLGQSMRHPFSKKIFIPIIIIILLAFGGSLIYKYQNRKKKNPA